MAATVKELLLFGVRKKKRFIMSLADRVEYKTIDEFTEATKAPDVTISTTTGQICRQIMIKLISTNPQVEREREIRVYVGC